MRNARMEIAGMSCGHCVSRVDGALRGLAGVEVEEVTVGGVRFRFDPEAVSRERITETIEEAGFGPAAFVEG